MSPNAWGVEASNKGEVTLFNSSSQGHHVTATAGQGTGPESLAAGGRARAEPGVGSQARCAGFPVTRSGALLHCRQSMVGALAGAGLRRHCRDQESGKDQDRLEMARPQITSGSLV